MFNIKNNTMVIYAALVVIVVAIIMTAAKCVGNECSIPSRATPAVENPVKIIGSTQDGKYNIYDLKGDYSDQLYTTSGSVVYRPEDLPIRLQFIAMEDANNGEYVCGFVCKNKQDQIVGINPTWARTYGLKEPQYPE